MKKFKLFFLLSMLTSLSFGQLYKKAYLVTGLGNNLEQAEDTYCSGHPSLLTSVRLQVFSRQPFESLQLDRLYQFIDDENKTKYVYILKETNFRGDSDSHLVTDLSLESTTCDRNNDGLDNDVSQSYVARNFGYDLSEALSLYCSSKPSEEGQRLKLNTLKSSTEPFLFDNSLYELNDEGRTQYVYIIKKHTSYYSDRDDSFSSDFTLENVPFCDDDNDGIINRLDNCPNTKNSDQKDSDNDGLGDVCDTFDNRDSDGDGVPNGSDKCDTEKGPASNEGCPGIPDLIIDLNRSSYSANNCSFNCSSRFNNISGDPEIRTGGDISFGIHLKNIGNGDFEAVNPIRIKVYASSNATLEVGPRNDVLIDTHVIPSRFKLKAGTSSGFISFRDDLDYESLISYNRLKQLTSSSKLLTGYLIFVVEITQPRIDIESNSRNNSFVMRYLLVDTVSAKNISEELYNNNYVKPHELQIFNIQGQLISNDFIDTKSTENETKSQLPTGLYFIKSNGKVTKEYISN